MPAPLLLKVLAPVVVAGVVAACQKALQEAGQRPLDTLAETEWRMPDGLRTVAFRNNGEVSGSGGCNQFFGSFEQSAGALTFGPLASTKKACPPGVMAAEASFLNMLAAVRRAQATRTELVLFGDQGELARLSRA